AEARTVRDLAGSLAAPPPPPRRTTPPATPAAPAARTPHYTVYDGVVFCEKKLPGSENLEEVEVKLSGIRAQLKSLDDVKEALAEQVRETGGNCLNFLEYGQKSTSWSFDSVAWFGKGVAGALPDDLYQQLIQRRGERWRAEPRERPE